MKQIFKFSSSASSTISSKQMQHFNKTTSRLYRMLLREYRLLNLGDKSDYSVENKSNLEAYDERKFEHQYLLLQQQLDPRDWGRARLYPSNENSTHYPKSRIILEFLHQFRLKLNGFEPSLQTHGSSSAMSSQFGEDESILVSKADIFETIKSSFREPIPQISQEEILNRHRTAIDAIRILQLQISMSQRTCVTLDSKRGLRVIATSRCIGKAASSPKAALHGDISNRFAYRIRVENTGLGEGVEGGQPVQLLGRFWSIEEEGQDACEAVEVKAPTTGAVGHLPVIHPGEIFEYMSGCEIATKTGFLSGRFYMAEVDNETQSAMVGDAVKALEFGDERKFEMPIGPFKLVSEVGDNGERK